MALTSRFPCIIAVQAAGWSSLSDQGPVDSPARLADGIMIKSPKRLDQMRRAIADSNGQVLVVNDEAIASAHNELLGQGIWGEPTAAAVWAGVRNLGNGERRGLRREPKRRRLQGQFLNSG
jgi:threonine synthase